MIDYYYTNVTFVVNHSNTVVILEDIFVKIHEVSHETFVKEVNNIRCNFPVAKVIFSHG